MAGIRVDPEQKSSVLRRVVLDTSSTSTFHFFKKVGYAIVQTSSMLDETAWSRTHEDIQKVLMSDYTPNSGKVEVLPIARDRQTSYLISGC